VFETVSAAARQADLLRETAHRPWPLPSEPWALGQTLERLLLAHWPVPAAALRPLVPARLELETHGGEAWLGIVAGAVESVRFRGSPPLPVVSRSLEVNMRTYVRLGERPGILFLSLDLSSPLAFRLARSVYGLPAFRSRLTLQRGDEWNRLSAARVGAPRPYVFSARYRALAEAVPNPLSTFVTDRYCLYAEDRRGTLRRAEFHRLPWKLREAECELELNTMAPDGVEYSRGEPRLHFVARQDALLWPLEPV